MSPAQQPRHAVVSQLHAKQRCDAREDDVTAAVGTSSTRAAAVTATTIDEADSAATTVTAQRNERDWSRDIEIPLATHKRVCTEMNTRTEAHISQNKTDSGDPASPELLVKVNKKNSWKYTKI